MGVGFWVFVRHPDGSFYPVPTTRFKGFHERSAKLFDWVKNEALIFEMAVDIENRQPVRPLKAWFTRYKIDRDGLWDETHKSSAMMEEFEMMGHRQKDIFANQPLPVDDLVDDINLNLSRRWDPSSKDLVALCLAVNKRAKRTLLTPSSPVLHKK